MKYAVQKAFVEDLRELANLIESKGHKLPLDISDYYPMDLSHHLYDDDDGHSAKDQMVKIAKALGSSEKDYTYGSFELVKKMKNKLVTLTFSTARENVCTKRVVGTEIKERKKFVETGEMETYTEEIIEWDCDPLLK